MSGAIHPGNDDFRAGTQGAKANKQNQNMQRIPGNLGKASNRNKPMVKATLKSALPSNKNVNSQTNNTMPIKAMGPIKSPNSQKQDAFPTTFKKSGSISGKQVGGSGLGTSHIQGRDVNMTVRGKLPANTSPNNQMSQRSGTKIKGA